ncbi:MAG: alpha/beta hydrolase [Planctomycetes bacterium]|nr:alpha/beta hydrolase [Planctomycetota bacterium]
MGTACRPDYWIVSSRHCWQHAGPCQVVCPFEYFRVGPDGRWVRASREEFLASLVPNVPVCIVAHGSFVPFASVVADSRWTYAWIRAAAPEYPLHVVFYTWPSEAPITGIPQIDVAILGRRGGFNGFYLAQLINLIPPDHPVSLLGHSHGTRVIASALHLLSGGQVQGHTLDCSSPRRPLRAVFAAAAIDHNWLNPGERYDRALWGVEYLVNLQNHLDVVLGLYPLRKPFSRRALARSGFTTRDRHRLGWLAGKIAEFDVTNLVGLGHQWPNYNRHPYIAWIISPYLYYTDRYDNPPASTERVPAGSMSSKQTTGPAKRTTTSSH